MAQAPQRKQRLTQGERTARSDGRMYQAALELICEGGAQNTTLKDIGERAGFSRGLASNRFGTKEQLFERLIIDFNTRWRTSITERVGEAYGVQALCIALDVVADFIRSDPARMKAIYVLWFESVASHTNIRERLGRYHSAYRQDAAHWLQQGMADGIVSKDIDPAVAAGEFLAFIFGAIYQWIVSPEEVIIVERLAAFKETLEHRYAV